MGAEKWNRPSYASRDQRDFDSPNWLARNELRKWPQYKEAEAAAIAQAVILNAPTEVWLLRALNGEARVPLSERSTVGMLETPERCLFTVSLESESGASLIARHGDADMVSCMFWVTPEAAWRMMEKRENDPEKKESGAVKRRN